jgi:tRNA pseudouridine55 synthase
MNRSDVQASGVLLLDKPRGITSNAALQVVRRLLDRVKAGHTGTLDPLASGLLPICLGEATKFGAGLLGADKSYEATVQFGAATTTGDSEGEVTLEGAVTGLEPVLQAVLPQFRGELEQMPPMFSALKHQGRPLYAYAREGTEIARTARKVQILGLTIMENRFPEVVMRVRCSKGTYVRSLAHDLGMQLGCGAHLTALRRTSIGALDISEAITLSRFESMEPAARWAQVRGADLPLAHLPVAVVDAAQAKALLEGQQVTCQSMIEGSGPVRLYAEDGVFIGLGEVDALTGKIRPRRMRSDLRMPEATAA